MSAPMAAHEDEEGEEEDKEEAAVDLEKTVSVLPAVDATEVAVAEVTVAEVVVAEVVVAESATGEASDNVPNPFLIDDDADDDEPEPVTLVPQAPLPATTVVDLGKPEPLTPPVVHQTSCTPVPMAGAESDSELDVPVPHVPQLVQPLMFLSIQNVRLSFNLLWRYSPSIILLTPSLLALSFSHLHKFSRSF
jgi:hypothetical protein